MAKLAQHKQGWQTIDGTADGKTTTKTYKTFLATYEPVGEVIRVVIVKEEHDWFPFFSTDPNASVVEIVEVFADRATIEQDIHDIKEVWGRVNNKCGTSGRTWPSIISICGCIR